MTDQLRQLKLPPHPATSRTVAYRMSVLKVIQKVIDEVTTCSTLGTVVNIEMHLRSALQESGHNTLRATELAERWLDQLMIRLEARLEEWDHLGLPRPLIQSGAPTTLLTYKHSTYQSGSSESALPADYSNVLSFITSLSPRQFLLVGVCLLSLAGCDPIFVTDGARDEGVDCIGKINTGPTRSLCLFVQCKTSNADIRIETVRLDYDKYRTLQKRALFSTYMAALGGDATVDGRDHCYYFIGNAEFRSPVREYAKEENILLRSPRQIAFWLSKGFGITKLHELLSDIEGFLHRDLERNLAPRVKMYRTT